jgi:hypothetical protein
MGNFMTDSVLMPSRQYMQGLNNQQYINPMTMSLNQYVFEQQLMHQQAVQMQQIQQQQQQQSLNLGYELQQLYPRIPHNQNDFHQKTATPRPSTIVYFATKCSQMLLPIKVSFLSNTAIASI